MLVWLFVGAPVFVFVVVDGFLGSDAVFVPGHILRVAAVVVVVFGFVKH